MNFIGVDLHKKSITICVMDQSRKVLARKTINCKETTEIVNFFRKFRPFKVVVEATASYPWFVELVEPLADEVVLANPKKLRIIAESTKKTDKLDAQILAEFLVLDMIPRAYQPTPRQREHRTLIRHRQYLQGRITSVRSKIHNILSNYNADRKDVFSNGGLAYFKEVPLSDADRFVIKQLWALWEDFVAQRMALTKKMRITKEGSGLLRWALVESAWRLVGSSPKWSAMYGRLQERKGKKRAIVAVARKLLCVLYAMLRTRTTYKIVTTKIQAPEAPRKRLVLVRKSTAQQTPATETAKPSATLQRSAKAPAAKPSATAEKAAPRTTRKRSSRASTAEQTITV
jgi:hypothetical protein